MTTVGTCLEVRTAAGGKSQLTSGEGVQSDPRHELDIENEIIQVHEPPPPDTTTNPNQEPHRYVADEMNGICVPGTIIPWSIYRTEAETNFQQQHNGDERCRTCKEFDVNDLKIRQMQSALGISHSWAPGWYYGSCGATLNSVSLDVLQRNKKCPVCRFVLRALSPYIDPATEPAGINQPNSGGLAIDLKNSRSIGVNVRYIEAACVAVHFSLMSKQKKRENPTRVAYVAFPLTTTSNMVGSCTPNLQTWTLQKDGFRNARILIHSVDMLKTPETHC